ncbi:MAG: hypothetical protein HY033_05125, partial [Ignavibacteriae bacterium]|nr:hypothetical protein [Ignavibacteriota bacterium]
MRSRITFIVFCFALTLCTLVFSNGARAQASGKPGIAPTGDPGHPPGFEIDGDLRTNNFINNFPTSLDSFASDWVTFASADTSPDPPKSGRPYLDCSLPGAPARTSAFPSIFFAHRRDGVAPGETDSTVFTGSKLNGDISLTSKDTLKVVFGSAPQKDDMKNILIRFFVDATQQLWLVAAADRKATQGTSFLDFLIFQGNILYRPPLTSLDVGSIKGTGPAAGRTLGDFEITATYTGGGSKATLFFRKWQSVSGSFKYDTTGIIVPAGAAFVAGNSQTVKACFPTFNADSTYDSLAFVETAVNLSAIFQASGLTCENIKNIVIATKSSNVDNAELKDLTPPFGLSFCTAPPPVFTFCPTDQIINGCPGGATPTFGVASINAPCLASYDSTTTISGTCPKVYTRRWVVKNNCGDSAVCVQNITVQDVTAPVITCSGPKTIDCAAAVVFDTPTATDNCGTPVITILSTVGTVGSCVTESSYTRTWRATDACGNFADCSQTITKHDATKPVINCSGPKTIDCAAAVVFDTPTFSDNCDPNPVLSIISTVGAAGSCVTESSYTRTWRVTDCAGNFSECSQTITKHDNTAPVIICAAPKTIDCAAAVVFTAPTATDNCDPNPVITVLSTVATPGSCPTESSYTRTWRATDCAGNHSECSQTITKHDNTPPVITCAAAPSPIQCPATPVFLPPTVSDNCDPNPTVTFADVTTPGNCPGVYSVTRTWTATDCAGNHSSCSRTVNVVDTTPPVITCAAAPSPIQCPATPVFPAPTATDVCDPSPTITFADVL